MYGNSDHDWHEDENNKIRASAVSHEEFEREKVLVQLRNAVHAAETLARNPMPESVRYLQNLVAALDKAFISQWQSTAAWQKQLDDAREYLAAHGIKGDV